MRHTRTSIARALLLALGCAAVPALPLRAQVRIPGAQTQQPQTPMWDWEYFLNAVRAAVPNVAPAPREVSAAEAWNAMAAYNQCIPTQLHDPNKGCDIPPLTRCTVTVQAPDSLALVTPGHRRLERIAVWLQMPGRRPEPKWHEFHYPTAGDTLRVRLVDALCYNAHQRADPRNEFAFLIVERDGFHLAVSASDVEEERTEPANMWEDTTARPAHVIRKDGRVEPAIRIRQCQPNGGACTQWVMGKGERQEQIQEEYAAAMRATAQRLRELGYSQQAIDYVLRGEIAVGMDMVLVRTAWGEPDRVSRSQDQFGTSEFWHYDRYGSVYFTNGLVRQVTTRN